MNGNILLYALALAGLILLGSYFKNKRPAAALLCAFFAVNLAGGLCGVHLNLNPFSACVSLLGGTPGVVFLLLMNTFF